MVGGLDVELPVAHVIPAAKFPARPMKRAAPDEAELGVEPLTGFVTVRDSSEQGHVPLRPKGLNEGTVKSGSHTLTVVLGVDIDGHFGHPSVCTPASVRGGLGEPGRATGCARDEPRMKG